MCSLPFLYFFKTIWHICGIYDGIMFSLPPKVNLLFSTNFYENFTKSMINTISSPGESNYPDYLDTFLGLVDILGSFCRMQVAYDVDYLMFAVTFVLWVPCKYFSQVAKKEMDNNFAVAEILEMFDDLKVLSDLLNEKCLTGWWLHFCWTCCSIIPCI